VRFNPAEVSVARRVGFDHAGLDNSNASLQHHADALAELASVDAMALLGCNFLLALEHVSLPEAQVYLSSLERAVDRFHHRWVAMSPTIGALKVLLGGRVIRRQPDELWVGWLDFRRLRRRYADPGAADGFHWSKVPMWIRGTMPVRGPMFVPDPAYADFRTKFPAYQAQARDAVMTLLSDLEAKSGTLDSVAAAELAAIRLELTKRFVGEAD
jgi:hypothetical protein